MIARAAITLLLMASATLATAQAWAVQTVALRDYREAQAAAQELRDRSFDAYTEFAMQDGLQFVRVRIGCYTDRAAAEAMASVLAGKIVSEAAVVEFTSGAPAHACATSTVGFVKPGEWEPLTEPGAVPAFAVKVAGREARVVHDGTRWRVLQGLGPIPEAAAEPAGEFQELVRGGVRFVAQKLGSKEYVVCPGRLLAHVGKVAIVEQGDLLVACEFTEETP
ncbi:MAG: SPOR domain-containing protein [Trueperaceae bacterium]|nr:SPOR domain-containing protein [Truepera sp.]